MADYKNRIVELEKIVAIQNRNIDNLQSALRSLTDAWQESGEGSAASALPISTKNLYGKSRAIITRHNQTTIKKLKENKQPCKRSNHHRSKNTDSGMKQEFQNTKSAVRSAFLIRA